MTILAASPRLIFENPRIVGGRAHVGLCERIAGVLVAGVVLGTTAVAQTRSPAQQFAAPAPAVQAPAPAPAAEPPERPGFIDWMEQGVATVGAGFGTMVGAIGGRTVEAARDAADTAAAVTRLPSTSIVGGRERCLLAPNGAPDCGMAAQAMCQAHGFQGGSSVDFETSENCPPAYRRVSSRNRPEGVCTLEHFVTRSFCR
jgi:hypothetical protein